MLPAGFVLDKPALDPKRLATVIGCATGTEPGPWCAFIKLAETLPAQLDADRAEIAWAETQEKQHPHCAPNVGSVTLADFDGMHASDRDALRQRSADAIRTSIITALVYGIAAPAGLLAMGLVVGWVIRGFRAA